VNLVTMVIIYLWHKPSKSLLLCLKDCSAMGNISVKAGRNIKVTCSLMPLCFFFSVPCSFVYCFPRKFTYAGGKNPNISAFIRPTANTVNSLPSKRRCSRPWGEDPPPSPFKRQYIPQNTPKRHTKLLKMKKKSEGFPDYFFSIKINYSH